MPTPPPPTPNITVNSNNSGNNFNPTPFPTTGTIASGSRVTFQAGGSAIPFFAYQIQSGNAVQAFTENPPYTAPASPSSNSYTLANNITAGTVTLLVSHAPEAQGVNGTINVGGTGGDE